MNTFPVRPTRSALTARSAFLLLGHLTSYLQLDSDAPYNDDDDDDDDDVVVRRRMNVRRIVLTSKNVNIERRFFLRFSSFFEMIELDSQTKNDDDDDDDERRIILSYNKLSKSVKFRIERIFVKKRNRHTLCVSYVC